jgi:tRNA wybutosine-synthesizing protein 3
LNFFWIIVSILTDAEQKCNNYLSVQQIPSAMDFDNAKKMCMSKMKTADKSRKHSIDTQILPLIDHINALPQFYTTSSCSGRIYLLTEPSSKAKPDVLWLYVSHEQVQFKDIQSALKNLPQEPVWFRQEGLILHIACKSIIDAENILILARSAGFRRSGIITQHKRIVVEICSTEKMDAPIANKGTLLVSEQYMQYLIDKSNEKFEENRKKTQKFFNALKKVKSAYHET